jgi:hypothetical protein
MKSYEFLKEDELSSIEANVFSALSLLAGKIKAGELPDELPTNMIIRYIRNTGISNFNVENLLDINEKNSSIKNIIKSISQNRIKFKTENIPDADSDSDADSSSDENAAEKNVVSSMAKSALKRRS